MILCSLGILQIVESKAQDTCRLASRVSCGFPNLCCCLCSLLMKRGSTCCTGAAGCQLHQQELCTQNSSMDTQHPAVLPQLQQQELDPHPASHEQRCLA
jgi:hypothetical protein